MARPCYDLNPTPILVLNFNDSILFSLFYSDNIWNIT